MRNAKTFCPIGYAKAFSIELNHAHTAGVSALLFACCPAAIVWLVISLVVDTVNTVIDGRSFSHIRYEVFKGISPSPANDNAPGSVIRKSRRLPTMAPANHTSPSGIFVEQWRIRIACSMLPCSFVRAASAAFCGSARKCITIANGNGSTIASAFKHGCRIGSSLFYFHSCIANDCPSSETFASQVLKSWGRGLSFDQRKAILGHDSDLQMVRVLNRGCYKHRPVHSL